MVKNRRYSLRYAIKYLYLWLIFTGMKMQETDRYTAVPENMF